MNRREKELVVQSLRESFAQSPASFIVGFRGLSVGQLQNLRSQLRNSGGSFKIAKARLMKIAVGDLEDAQALDPYLKDQIGVVFASDEPPAVAKVLRDFAKASDAFHLVAGMLDKNMLDETGIVRIASLPSKEVLLGQLCGTLNAPIVKLAFVLNMQIMQLLLVLQQVAKKKQ